MEPAMHVAHYPLHDRLADFALIAMVASFALVPWLWLILVW
jgi:hypothetical protein